MTALFACDAADRHYVQLEPFWQSWNTDGACIAYEFCSGTRVYESLVTSLNGPQFTAFAKPGAPVPTNRHTLVHAVGVAANDVVLAGVKLV